MECPRCGSSSIVEQLAEVPGENCDSRRCLRCGLVINKARRMSEFRPAPGNVLNEVPYRR